MRWQLLLFRRRAIESTSSIIDLLSIKIIFNRCAAARPSCYMFQQEIRSWLGVFALEHVSTAVCDVIETSSWHHTSSSPLSNPQEFAYELLFSLFASEPRKICSVLNVSLSSVSQITVNRLDFSLTPHTIHLIAPARLTICFLHEKSVLKLNSRLLFGFESWQRMWGNFEKGGKSFAFFNSTKIVSNSRISESVAPILLLTPDNKRRRRRRTD